MPKRKPGGQQNNTNALKHGRYSKRLRAERHAAWLAAEQAREAKHREWVKSVPRTDYAAICAAIEAASATKH